MLRHWIDRGAQYLSNDDSGYTQLIMEIIIENVGKVTQGSESPPP